MTIEVRQLSETDARDQFEAEHEKLTEFFRRYAGQNQFKRRVGTTYIAVAEGHIVGYATVAAGTVRPESLGPLVKGLPAYDAPVLRLARLARDKHATPGAGTVLMRHVFKLAVQMSRDLGCIGVVTDPKDARAVAYYTRFGFAALTVPEGSATLPPMFLAIGSIEKAIAEAQAG